VEIAVGRVIVDGRLAVPGEGWDPAVTTYGHFTAMQVRDRRTRGFELHLARLREATHELFGTPLDEDHVRRSIRLALADDVADASVRVYVVHTEAGPSSIVTSKAPVEAPPSERVRSVLYQRPLPHLKHLGGFRIGALDAQSYFRRQVQAEGYDEALFTTADGTIAEAAIANVGFVAGSTIVWPDAPALPGITMQLVQRELTRTGREWRREQVQVQDVASFDGAFLTNSHGIWPVTSIDDHDYVVDERWIRPLAGAYDAVEWDEI
jgi:branched-subunit amino acid aminotransferase/4-amino-4-deoxychorismate lyase